MGDKQEATRLIKQVALDAEKNALQRNKLGQFATPPALAREFLRIALSYLPADLPLRFLDPAVGTGSLYSALLSQVGGRTIDNAWGVEIDVSFARAAAEIWGRSGLDVTQADFTTLPVPRLLPTLIAANPPYVRHHHLSGEAKKRLADRAEEITGVRPSGLTGLYIHMLLSSLPWMAPGGVGAWLIPSEWLDVNYGSILREFFARGIEVTLLRVHRFNAKDTQFADALVSSCLVFFKKAPAPTCHEVKFTLGASAAPASAISVPLTVLRTRTKWSAQHTPETQEAQNGPTIGDLFSVKRGIATGSNAVFIKPRSEFVSLGIPKRFLKPIMPPSRNLTADVVEARPDGYPAVSPLLALLDVDVDEDILATRYPQVAAYLLTEDAQQSKKSYLSQSRKLWYAQEKRDSPLYVLTYMGRGRGPDATRSPFRVILNKSNAIATNGYLCVYPNETLKATIACTPGLGEKVRDALATTISRWYRTHGRVYGGGLHKLEPKELKSMPMADSLVGLIRGASGAGTILL